LLKLGARSWSTQWDFFTWLHIHSETELDNHCPFVSAKAESPIGNVEKRAASDFVSSDARSGREKSSMTVPSNLAEGAATASVLVIGNEILSGRTKDANLVYIAKGLSDVGVTLREARVVPELRRGHHRNIERLAIQIRLRLHDGRRRSYA
jgi:hypothetical protein